MRDPLGMRINQACREHGVGLSPVVTVQTYHAALSMAEYGLGADHGRLHRLGRRPPQGACGAAAAAHHRGHERAAAWRSARARCWRAP
jgi:hypothetical protein